MTAHDDDLEQVLGSWMHRHAPDAPSDLVLRIYGEIETMSEQTRSQRWLSRFAAWPAAAWVAVVAAMAILAVAGGALLVSFATPPLVTTRTPTPTVSPAPFGTTGVVDRLIAAWNNGDGQQTAGLYGTPAAPSDPVVRFMINSGSVTDQVALGDVASAVTAWHEKGSVLTRTGNIVSEGPYAGFPVTWTSADGSFDGVEVIRVSADDLVTEEYLIGATASSPTAGSLRSAAVVTLMDDEIGAENTSNGTLAASHFASSAQGFVFRDDALANTYSPSSSGFKDAVDKGQVCCTTRTGRVLTQGPFALFPATASGASGAAAGGMSVSELTDTGQIEYVWHIDTTMSQPAPSPSLGLSTSDWTAVADGLLSAWNGGASGQVGSLYDQVPLVRIGIDASGAFTAAMTTRAQVAAGMTDWHAKGSVLSRAGSVLTQGPYAAFPVTWTSSDGSFDGVEVIRVSADRLVTEQYLIGAAPSTAKAAGTGVVNDIHDPMTPWAASFGSASAGSFAPLVVVRQFEDGEPTGTLGPSDIAAAIWGDVSTPTHVGAVETVGPFAVYGVSIAGPAGPGVSVADEGFTVLELIGAGEIQYAWDFRTTGDWSASSPAASGG